MTVTQKSHHFVVSEIDPRARPVIDAFTRGFIQYGYVRGQGGHYHRAPLRVFAAATEDRLEFRYHINTLEAFKQHIHDAHLGEGVVRYLNEGLYEPTKVDLVVKPHLKDREHQVPVVEYITKSEPPAALFVALQTGLGKSMVAMRSISIFGELPVITIKPMYIEKWVEDLLRTYDNVTREDIMIIRGSDSLIKALHLAEDGQLDCKIIICSNKTFQNYLFLYEKMKYQILDAGYPCMPDKFYETLGAGIALSDETHQDFHLNYKTMLYTNVPRSISLSATLISDDDFVSRMQNIAFPFEKRYHGPAYMRYVNVKAIFYHLKHPNKVRTKEYGSKTYSHHAFEKSIMRNPEMLRNYMMLVFKLIHGTYMVNHVRGQRLLIFVASKELANLMVDFLRKGFPTFDIRRYTEEDPFDNIMEAEMTVTTLISAGAAIDIAGLRTVICTTAISSSSANLQALGRLRDLKDGTNMEYCYLVAEEIAKQCEYHERKQVLFKERALSHKAVFMSERV